MKKIMMLAFTSLLALSGCVVTAEPFGARGDDLDGRGAETIACTPGFIVDVGCGALGLGSCDGDPILTVCDGSFVNELDCGDVVSDQLARNDDAEGRCPGLDVECPASGLLAVRPTAFGSSRATCFWDTAE